jgi:hypothetical protein
MKSRLVLFTLTLYMIFSVVGCSSKQSTSDNSNGTTAADAQNSADNANASSTNQAKQQKEVKREPIVVRAGTAVTVSLGGAIGSKVSQAGQTFTGTVAKNVVVGSIVAIPKGAAVSGTVTDAKPLGKFAGGAVLEVRLDSITLHGADVPVETALRTFNVKGKGKRTAVMAGGGAALGGIVGALAGGGKGAAIGMAAGGGAGAGGAAFTGNKDIVLPAESAVTFELSKALEVRR